MNDKKTALTIRIDKDLADEFKRVCDEKDYSQSFVIRELMKKWLSDNKQRDLFKWGKKGSLWNTKRPFW